MHGPFPTRALLLLTALWARRRTMNKADRSVHSRIVPRPGRRVLEKRLMNPGRRRRRRPRLGDGDGEAKTTIGHFRRLASFDVDARVRVQ